MLAGELYYGFDPELAEERLEAQQLLFELDSCPPRDTTRRAQLLGQLLGELGEGAVVQQGLRCDYGYNISIGDRTFINYDCTILDCNLVRIGADVQIAPGVHIYTATHPLDPEERRSGLEYARPVTIQDGAWLGGGVIVGPGVTIGENSVIGAGSVVVRSIPPNVLAVGNPCRPIRQL